MKTMMAFVLKKVQSTINDELSISVLDLDVTNDGMGEVDK